MVPSRIDTPIVFELTQKQANSMRNYDLHEKLDIFFDQATFYISEYMHSFMISVASSYYLSSILLIAAICLFIGIDFNCSCFYYLSLKMVLILEF